MRMSVNAQSIWTLGYARSDASGLGQAHSRQLSDMDASLRAPSPMLDVQQALGGGGGLLPPLAPLGAGSGSGVGGMFGSSAGGGGGAYGRGGAAMLPGSAPMLTASDVPGFDNDELDELDEELDLADGVRAVSEQAPLGGGVLQQLHHHHQQLHHHHQHHLAAGVGGGGTANGGGVHGAALVGEAAVALHGSAGSGGVSAAAGRLAAAALEGREAAAALLPADPWDMTEGEWGSREQLWGCMHGGAARTRPRGPATAAAGSWHTIVGGGGVPAAQCHVGSISLAAQPARPPTSTLTLHLPPRCRSPKRRRSSGHGTARARRRRQRQRLGARPRIAGGRGAAAAPVRCLAPALPHLRVWGRLCGGGGDRWRAAAAVRSSGGGGDRRGGLACGRQRRRPVEQQRRGGADRARPQRRRAGAAAGAAGGLGRVWWLAGV
jgi:hypothetical protein